MTVQVKCSTPVAQNKCSTNSYPYYSIKFKTGSPWDETTETRREQITEENEWVQFYTCWQHSLISHCSLKLKERSVLSLWDIHLVIKTMRTDERSQGEHKREKSQGQGWHGTLRTFEETLKTAVRKKWGDQRNDSIGNSFQKGYEMNNIKYCKVL